MFEDNIFSVLFVMVSKYVKALFTRNHSLHIAQNIPHSAKSHFCIGQLKAEIDAVNLVVYVPTCVRASRFTFGNTTS